MSGLTGLVHCPQKSKTTWHVLGTQITFTYSNSVNDQIDFVTYRWMRREGIWFHSRSDTGSILKWKSLENVTCWNIRFVLFFRCWEIQRRSCCFCCTFRFTFKAFSDNIFCFKALPRLKHRFYFSACNCRCRYCGLLSSLFQIPMISVGEFCPSLWRTLCLC